MIGKAYVSLFPFYDTSLHKMSYKRRPVLIIGQSGENDYVALPISRVTKKEYLDANYDIELNPDAYPLMNLVQTSYVRTHKQIVIHRGELSKCIMDFKTEYPDCYLDILVQVEAFQKQLLDDAI